MSFRVAPLGYSASYCFSLHGYQKWTDIEDTLLEESLIKILRDSLKGKAVFPHRIIRKDLGPLSNYWVNSKGKTLLLHTVRWFDNSQEYEELKRDSKKYRSHFNHTFAAVKRKQQALQFFHKAYSHNLPHSYMGIKQRLSALLRDTQRLPHGFDPKSRATIENFDSVEKSAVSFMRYINDVIQGPHCRSHRYNPYCHLLTDLHRDSKIFDQNFKSLLDAYRKQKHAWSALETKLEVFREKTKKKLTEPIFLSGENHVVSDTPQGKRHISFGFGALMGLGVYGNNMFSLQDSALQFYSSINFYFSAVDTNIPLAIDGGFSRRFSFNLGVTITEMHDSKSEVSGIAMNRGMITGIGYRVSDNLKIGFGLLWYQRSEFGGATEHKRLKVSPYLALAMDLDLARMFFNKAKSAGQ